jgi:hypothetical protein
MQLPHRSVTACPIHEAARSMFHVTLQRALHSVQRLLWTPTPTNAVALPAHQQLHACMAQCICKEVCHTVHTAAVAAQCSHLSSRGSPASCEWSLSSRSPCSAQQQGCGGPAGAGCDPGQGGWSTSGEAYLLGCLYDCNLSCSVVRENAFVWRQGRFLSLSPAFDLVAVASPRESVVTDVVGPRSDTCSIC